MSRNNCASYLVNLSFSFFSENSYKILSADRTAITIVEAVLKNESEVAIPKYYNIFIRIFQTLPYWTQNFIRDQIMNESEIFFVKGFDEM